MDDDEDVQGESTPQDASKNGARSMAMGCLGMVVAIIVGAVACTALASGGGKNQPPSSYEAEYQCQQWVRDKLKAPSTAKFSNTVTTGGPVSWSSHGDVDAQNSFGAMVRSTWTCTIRLDGDTWRGNVNVQG